MPTIKCEWIMCKYNNGKRKHLGDCLYEYIVQLEHFEETNEMGDFFQGLECKNYIEGDI